MLETKSLTVSPDEEQETIDVMQDFGWSVKSSQEINSKESHLERRGDDIYNVTTKENYVKLVFCRDTKMESYNEITELEQRYFNALEVEPDYNPPEMTAIFLALGCFLYIFPGIIYWVYMSRKKKKYEEEYLRRLERYQQSKENAMIYRKQARALL